MSPFNRREVGPWEALSYPSITTKRIEEGKKRPPKCRREAVRQHGRCCGTASGIHLHGAAFRPATSPHSSAPGPTRTDCSSCWRRAGVPQPAENVDGDKTCGRNSPSLRRGRVPVAGGGCSQVAVSGKSGSSACICLSCSGQGLPAPSCTLFDPQHLLLCPRGLSDTLSIYPFLSRRQDIHEVRGQPGERPEEGRYALLWAFLGLLPLCFWSWSLTGRETWPARSHRLIFSMERWSYGWWNIFISHRKKAKPLPTFCLWLHKDRLFLACADLNKVSPPRKMISGHCLKGTQEIAFGKSYWRAQPGHSSSRDMWSRRSSSAPV